MEIQRLLGSDIQMQLDECVRLPCSRRRSRARDAAVAALGGALARRPSARSRGRRCSASSRAARSKRLRRRERARARRAWTFHGYAIGGLAVGEPQAVMLAMIETVEPHLPADKPRYLMGVGTPDDLLARRCARRRHVRLRDADAGRPPRPGLYAARPDQSAQRALRRRSAADRRLNRRAPRRAIIRAPIGIISSNRARSSRMMALTAINLAYYQDLMAGARAAIAAGRLADYVAEVRAGWARRRGGAGVVSARLRPKRQCELTKRQGRACSEPCLFCTCP